MGFWSRIAATMPRPEQLAPGLSKKKSPVPTATAKAPRRASGRRVRLVSEADPPFGLRTPAMPAPPLSPRRTPAGHPYIMRDHLAAHVDDCPAGMCVIYALVDPRDNTVRYVGKTEKPGARYTSHIRGDSTYNKRLASWIRNLWRKRRMRPAMVPIETVEEAAWAASERRWIAFYRRRGALFNIEPGGPSRPRR